MFYVLSMEAFFPSIFICTESILYLLAEMSFNTLQNNPQEQQSAFDTVNSILNSQKTVSPQLSSQSQSLKIQELNTLCRQLIAANMRLNQQIQFLKEELEARPVSSSQNVSYEEYSEIQLDFTDIEQNIRAYRCELERYQKSIAQQLKEKTGFVENLKDEVARGKEREQGMAMRIGEMENQRAALTETKNSLLAQIEELESEVRSSKLQSPRSFRKNYDYRDNKAYGIGNGFADGVEEQLQKLIQKLIKQLQYEKYLKRKLTGQNRRLQDSIIQLQKEIACKNNKIYQLQLTIIKNNKHNSSSGLIFANNNKVPEGSPRRNIREASKISKNMRRFTFMEIVNRQIKLNMKEKLSIALKTIDFYIRKVQNQDYSSHALQSIFVTNFTLNQPKFIMIKASNSTTDTGYEETESEVAWNLAFLLENLLNQQSENSHFADVAMVRGVIDFLGQTLENKEGNGLDTIFELRKVVEKTIDDISN